MFWKKKKSSAARFTLQMNLQSATVTVEEVVGLLIYSLSFSPSSWFLMMIHSADTNDTCMPHTNLVNLD